MQHYLMLSRGNFFAAKQRSDEVLPFGGWGSGNYASPCRSKCVKFKLNLLCAGTIPVLVWNGDWVHGIVWNVCQLQVITWTRVSDMCLSFCRLVFIILCVMSMALAVLVASHGACSVSTANVIRSTTVVIDIVEICHLTFNFMSFYI